MAGESATKRVFPTDIFAEDNDKWTWPLPSATVKNPAITTNFAALRKASKDESGSSSSSEGESTFRNDSNSLKRSFRKRGSSSTSEGNPIEDASSSPGPSGALPHERVLPSMYDDDARSASPSTYEKKDLPYASSFHKEFVPFPSRSLENSPLVSYENKEGKSKVSEKDASKHNSKDISQCESSLKNSKTESRKYGSQRSRSKSRDRRAMRRSRSRSCSKGKRTRSPVRERRKSRSKDRYSDKERRYHSKRSRSRDSKRRSRSRSRESKRRSRSHSRDSRRRSRSRDSRRRSRSLSKGRRSRGHSYDKHHRGHYRSSSHDRYRRKRYSRSRSRSRDRSKGRSGSGNRKPGSLPLSTSGGAMTPQMALQQTMAAMSAKAQALTGIALPKYYNPAAVNPLKYAEQVQKRKLLWQSSEKVVEQPKNTVWDKLTFAQDQDGKMTAKFRKLMGIKSEGTPAPPPPPEEKESVLKKQEELFRDLDQQYEMARMTTHTQRGVGLGYSAQALYPPIQK